jgi:hypothetical protein
MPGGGTRGGGGADCGIAGGGTADCGIEGGGGAGGGGTGGGTADCGIEGGSTAACGIAACGIAGAGTACLDGAGGGAAGEASAAGPWSASIGVVEALLLDAGRIKDCEDVGGDVGGEELAGEEGRRKCGAISKPASAAAARLP